MMMAETSLPEAMAGRETHEKVEELVSEFEPSPAAFVDLGAGQGAFAHRRHRLGHVVVAADGDPGNWRLNEIPVLKVNFDEPFSSKFDGRRFDAAVAIEIIEHVENPFAFLRETARILKPGGLLFLTTPNVESVASRLIFLYTGRLSNFGAYETVRTAHITPMFRWKLEMALDEAGFERVADGFNRTGYRTGENVKSKISGIVGRIIEPMLKGVTGGESRILAARLKS
jgi:SAM-dependent methyltransferase